MATDEERLVVALEARINDFEKRMKQAERTGTDSFQKIRRGSKTATEQMEADMARSTTRINQSLATVGTKIGNFGRAFGAGLVGSVAGMGIAGIIGRVHDLAKGVAEVGDQAKTAGLGLKEFQKWKYAAEQNRIGLDAMIDGFKELSLRADEYVKTGAGSAAESFQRLGMSQEEVKERLKNPSDLMLELIDRTRRLKDTAAGIRIFDELLGGTGGEQFVRLIEQGRDGLSDTLTEAENVVALLDEDMVRSAEEVDKAFNRIATTVGTELKGAVVEAYKALVAFKSIWDGINDSSAEGLMARRSQLETRRRQLEEEGGWQDTPLSWLGKDTATERTAIDKQLKEINDELERRKKLNTPVVIEPPVDPIDPPEKPSKNDGGRGNRGGGGSRNSRDSSADREREAVKELIAELEEELRLVNATDQAKRASVASRQAGAAATETERQRIVELNEAIYQEEEARRRLEDQTLLARDLTRAGIDDLFSALEDGKGLWQSMGDVAVNSLKRIADTLIDDVLDSIFKVNRAAGGGGGALGWIGSLFGGGSNQFSIASGGGVGLYASGGYVRGPGGPRDDRINARLSNGEFVVNAEATRHNRSLLEAINSGIPGFANGGMFRSGSNRAEPMTMPQPRASNPPVSASGSQTGVHVTVGVSVDNNGNLKAYVQDVAQTVSSSTMRDGLDQYNREVLPGRVSEINNDPYAVG